MSRSIRVVFFSKVLPDDFFDDVPFFTTLALVVLVFLVIGYPNVLDTKTINIATPPTNANKLISPEA